MDTRDFNDSQKTVYVLERKGAKRQRTSQPILNGEYSEGKPLESTERIPFLQLLSGAESLDNVKLRYRLLSENIAFQEKETKRIFDEVHIEALAEISSMIQSPITDQLDTAVLLSGSNLSNSSSFVEKVKVHLGQDPNNKIIAINSKDCTTIKVTLRRIVLSILRQNADREVNENEDDDDDSDGFEMVENIEFNSDAEDDENETYTKKASCRSELDREFDERLPFDLELVKDWVEQLLQKQNQTIENTPLRIVLLFEDLDSFNIRLLNILIKLLSKWSSRLPLKLVFNIGTSLKSFSKKLETKIQHVLKIHSFKVEQPNLLINKIVTDVILDDYLMLGNDSLNLILNRFENSLGNVEELLKTIKFLKMVFFYNQPLSVIGISIGKKESIELTDEYYSALRMLTSFKTYVENSLKQNPKSSDILTLLYNNDYLQNLLISSTHEYLDYLKYFKNIFRFITQIILPHVDNITDKNYLKIYAKLKSREFVVRNQFINEIVMSLREITASDFHVVLDEIYSFASSHAGFDLLSTKLQKRINVNELQNFPESDHDKIAFKIELRKQIDILTTTITNFLQKYLKNPSEFLFCELFTLNGVEVAISSLFPEVREITFDALSDPERYLNSGSQNPLLEKLDSRVNPIVCELFQICRETTLNINIYDFYQVFKSTLQKEKILGDLHQILDSSDNLLEKYLNDEPRFKFIYQFFNDVTVSEESKWDKFSLVLFLQKCGELINAGYFKQIKRKRESLEKCVWKGL